MPLPQSNLSKFSLAVPAVRANVLDASAWWQGKLNQVQAMQHIVCMKAAGKQLHTFDECMSPEALGQQSADFPHL